MHPQAKLSYVTAGSYLCSYDALVIADYEDDEEDDDYDEDESDEDEDEKAEGEADGGVKVSI